MPPALLPMWILGIFSVALLWGGGYVLYERWIGVAVAATVFWTGVAMLVTALLGRFLVLAVHRGGDDDPTWADGPETRRLTRPDGTVLHVETAGPRDRPSIVLVHGWGADNRTFYYTKRSLSATYRVIAWDLRGLGKSSRAGGNDYSLDAMADDLAAVVDLAETPAIVVGHSIGGMIALTFARRHARRLGSAVRGLVIVGAPYTDPMRTTLAAPLMRALERPLFTPLMYAMIVLSPAVWAMNWLSYLNGSLMIATGLTGFSGRETRGQLHFATLFFAKARPGVLARGMLAMFRFDETATLEKIPVPVLVVSNDRDPVVVPSASAHLDRVVPRTTLGVLSPARHMGLIERHAQFDAMLAKFIETHAAVATA